MSTVLSTSESKFLERARIALTNALNHAEIKPKLASFGFDDAKINEGWAVYNSAKTAWESNQVEDSESSVASNAYNQAYDELESLFKRHREQSLIFFKKQPDFLVRLGVKGNFPRTYAEFFDKSKAFYTAIQNNADIQKQLTLCKITPEVVTDCLNKHKNVLALRANFDKEKGESQESTKTKNAQLLDLKEWMDDFDIMAKIALYDSPQLLESLGIFVRS